MDHRHHRSHRRHCLDRDGIDGTRHRRPPHLLLTRSTCRHPSGVTDFAKSKPNPYAHNRFEPSTLVDRRRPEDTRGPTLWSSDADRGGPGHHHLRSVQLRHGPIHQNVGRACGLNDVRRDSRPVSNPFDRCRLRTKRGLGHRIVAVDAWHRHKLRPTETYRKEKNE
jgi:hypothetical protein